VSFQNKTKLNFFRNYLFPNHCKYCQKIEPSNLKCLQNNFLNKSTVKPVYNGHPWDLKKVAIGQRCLIKLRFRLVVDDSNWPLLTGGRCSQVVVKSGLTVFFNLSTISTNVYNEVKINIILKNIPPSEKIKCFIFNCSIFQVYFIWQNVKLSNCSINLYTDAIIQHPKSYRSNNCKFVFKCLEWKYLWTVSFSNSLYSKNKWWLSILI
jgi:hypothetical protein